MDRRKAITAAAAASLTVLAGAAGIALNSGIVGAGADDNVGQLSPVDTANPPVTVGVDDTATKVAGAPPVEPTTREPVTRSSASAIDDDGRDGLDERDEYEDGEDDDDRYEQEYEGADADD